MAGPDSITTDALVDDFLEHYGVKGMRWGKRKKVDREPASDDASRAAELNDRLKKSGTSALTNKELQEVVTRMNLEQQYSRLNPQSQSNGAAYASMLLAGGNAFATTKMGATVIDKYAGKYAPVVKGAFTVGNLVANRSKKK